MAATHYLHREGRVYIRVFPDKPISAKPLETRMGTGKGEVEEWVAVVKPGVILFEVGGVDEETAKGAAPRGRENAHPLPDDPTQSAAVTETIRTAREAACGCEPRDVGCEEFCENASDKEESRLLLAVSQR